MDTDQDRMELAKKLLAHAVGYMMDGCGNSYVNAYMEKWLDGAKSLGAYPSWMPTVGKIVKRKEKWEEYLDKSGGLPELDDLRKSGGKTIRVMREGRPATEEEVQAAVEGRPLPEVDRPSIGVKPRLIHDADRLVDLLEAMSRKVQAEGGRGLDRKYREWEEEAMAITEYWGSLEVDRQSKEMGRE